VLFLMVLPGTCAILLFPKLPRADMVYPKLILDLLPAGLVGLVVASFVAATMVSIGSILNSASTLITLDIVNQLRPGLSNATTVRIGRLTTASLLFVAVAWTPQLQLFPSLWQYLQAVLAYAVPPVVAVFLGGMYWRGATADGAVRADGGARADGAAGLPRSEPVPYGELPFDHSRVDVLRDVLSKLEAQGFRGVVKVTSSPGIFCLTGDAADGFVPAAATLPLSKCDLVGNPFEDSLSGQQRQSLSFANLVAGVRQRTAGAINVVTEYAASPHAAVAYPPHSDTLTAGEWNRAASANNRVEYSVEPAS